MNKNKLICIVGPTASGKTDLAKELSSKYNGEVISADSRQIYRGMDLGTGKDKSFHQYMIDIRDPNDEFSVAVYQKEVYKIIDKLSSEKKLPFLVGGTGLYIDAVIKGFDFPKVDQNIRQELESKSDDEIIRQLKELDTKSVIKYKNNRRRLIRALESCLSNSRPFSEYRLNKPSFEYLMLGIDLPREELYKRIDERVDKRIKEGMIEEVKELMKSGVNYEKMQRFGLEYRHLSNYLKNPSPDNLKFEILNLKFKSHAYARRQLTWFRRNKEINWIKNQSQAEKIISKFLK